MEKTILSIALILFGCNNVDNGKNYKQNIIGTWKEVGSKRSGFKMNDSTLVILDSALFYGEEIKYKINNDTLSFYRSNGKTSSQSAILVLTNDSLITSDETGTRTYLKVKR